MPLKRITTKVAQKTGIVKSKNRSEDLANLRAKYEQFTKNLKFLIKTLTNNHAAMVSYSKSRLEVAKAINTMTVDTPLFKCAGGKVSAMIFCAYDMILCFMLKYLSLTKHVLPHTALLL